MHGLGSKCLFKLIIYRNIPLTLTYINNALNAIYIYFSVSRLLKYSTEVVWNATDILKNGTYSKLDDNIAEACSC